MSELLRELDAVIVARRAAGDEQGSYVARLCASGLDHILKKVAEECGETLVAAKNAERSGDSEPLVREIADLWFHSMVLLASLDRSSQDVVTELQRRFGLSGLAEKSARGLPPREAGAGSAGTN